MVLHTHLPNKAKLNIMLTALKALGAQFVTMSEAFED